MKVLVCGGRDFKDRELVFEFLDNAHRENFFTHVIHGGARGADSLADEWARSRGIQPVRCDALWDTKAMSAGPIRNHRMLELGPDMVIAFPGGSGTKHMVESARSDPRITVIEVHG